MLAEVIKLEQISLADSAGVLRAIADQIEQGEYGKVIAGCVILESDEGWHVFGSGAADHIRIFAMLRQAENKILRGDV